METAVHADSATLTAELWVCRLGLVPYEQAVALQERLREMRQAQRIPDTLLLLEHPPVYTRGRRSAEDELSLGEAFYASKGIQVLCTDRGGRVTYHGPGQLVGYPIMALTDVIGHLRAMERAIIDALALEGIEARSRSQEGPDWTGVWVQDRKIASLGVHVQRGVSTHGFAVNVDNDLTPFSWVVPCGLSGVQMTSVALELAACGKDRSGASMQRLEREITNSFCHVHDRRAVQVPPSRLGIAGEPTQSTRAAA